MNNPRTAANTSEKSVQAILKRFVNAVGHPVLRIGEIVDILACTLILSHCIELSDEFHRVSAALALSVFVLHACLAKLEN